MANPAYVSRVESATELPEVFARARSGLQDAPVRHEVRIAHIGAPSSLAPYSLAFGADVEPAPGESGSEWGTGRFVVLYDPAEPEEWEGPWRVVCFAQAPLEPEIGADPLLIDVAWSWLTDALLVHQAELHSLNGTASKIVSRGFGGLANEGEGAQIELRASWSPQTADLVPHFLAWSDLLTMLAGLPPSSDGVTVLPSRRRDRG